MLVPFAVDVALDTARGLARLISFTRSQTPLFPRSSFHPLWDRLPACPWSFYIWRSDLGRARGEERWRGFEELCRCGAGFHRC